MKKGGLIVLVLFILFLLISWRVKASKNSVLDGLGLAVYEPPSFCPLNYAKDAQTRDFKLKDFHSKDGLLIPFELRGNTQILMDNLQVLQDFIPDNDIIITSGSRSPEHNKSQGGVSLSRHQCADGADLKVNGLSPLELYSIIEHLINEGKMQNGGLGLYSTHVHYDISTPRRWVG